MKLSEIRETLLCEHADLRARVADVRTTMDLWKAGQGSLAQVRSELATFANAVRTHNAREEQVLGQLMSTIDAWGREREEMMLEEHFKEHSEMYAALSSVSAAVEPSAWRQVVDQLLSRVLVHLLSEESAFLNPEVLHDDCVVVDIGG